MADVLEVSKSSRALCRTCRKSIAKGDLRFGEEVPSAFGQEGGTTHLFHHVACAAKKKPAQLRAALSTYVGEVPDREALEATMAESEPKQKPIHFPYVERASTGRSRCAACREVIEKGALRVATEREAEPSGMTMGAPRFFHAHCAPGRDAPAFFEALRSNSKGLVDSDFVELEAALARPS